MTPTDNWHALVTEAWMGNWTDDVEDAIRRGADPDTPLTSGSVTGITALMFAALGNSRLVKVLLDAGANPNARDSRGYTPLHYAACIDVACGPEHDAIERMRLLLAHGCDRTARTSDGKTALELLSQQAMPEMDVILAGQELLRGDRETTSGPE